MNYFKTLIITAVLFISTSFLFALPYYYYGNIAIKTDGNLVTSTNIQVRITIYDGATLLYRETFSSVPVDAFGAFTVNVGTGTLDLGTWPAGDATANMKTKAEIDYGSGWVSLGTKPTMQIILAATNGFSGDPSEIDVPNGEIIIGNFSNVGDTYPISGDATMTNTGVLTIANNAVTSAKILDGTIDNIDISPTAGIQVSKLAPGSNGQVLTVSGGVPTWANVSYTETDPFWTDAKTTTATTITPAWTFNNNVNIGVSSQSYQLSVVNDLSVPAVEVTGSILSTDGSSNDAVIDGPGGLIYLTDGSNSLTLDVLQNGIIFNDGTNNGILKTATLTTTRTWTLPDASGTILLNTDINNTVQPYNANTTILGSDIDLSSEVTGTLPIANGGTGATNANTALNNLLPNQTGNTGKFLQTDGINTSWQPILVTLQTAYNGGNTIITSGGNNVVISGSESLVLSSTTSSALVVNGNSSASTATFNTQTATSLNGVEINNSNASPDGYALSVNAGNGGASAAYFTADNITPDASVVVSNFGSGRVLYVDASMGTGSGLYVEGNSSQPTATFNTSTVLGLNGVEITNDGTNGYSLYVSASAGASAAAFDANTTTATAPSVLISNNDSGYGLYIDNTAGTGRALQAEANSTSYAASIVNNNNGGGLTIDVTANGGVGLSVDAYDATNPAVQINNFGTGLALSVADNGGAVKLSYESITVSGNAATISDNVSVVYITSDDDGNDDTVTLPTGIEGQFLYVIFVDPNNSGDDLILYDGINTIFSNVGTGNSVNVSLVFANGQWRVVSVVE